MFLVWKNVALKYIQKENGVILLYSSICYNHYVTIEFKVTAKFWTVISCKIYMEYLRLLAGLWPLENNEKYDVSKNCDILGKTKRILIILIIKRGRKKNEQKGRS